MYDGDHGTSTNDGVAEHLGKETERLNRTHGKQSIDYATAHFSQLRPELTDPSNPNGLASRDLNRPKYADG